MTKAEKVYHRDQYYQLLSAAKIAVSNSLYSLGIERALAACEFVDGMMQYESKYEQREFSSVEAIDLILQWAPLIFDLQSLDRLAALLKSQKRIDRNASDDLTDNVARAKKWMWAAHAIWDQVERSPGIEIGTVSRLIGYEDNRCEEIVEAWKRMGLILLEPHGGKFRLLLATRTEGTVKAKCSSCGVLVRGTQRKLLDDQKCPKCTRIVAFVTVARENTYG
ncbi:MAG: hypothetical protein AB7O62_17260 [Pirellulales bacterium]